MPAKDCDSCSDIECSCSSRFSSAGRGLVDAALLAAVAEKPSYGYELRKRVDEMTAGAVNLDPGTMYRTLRRLEEEGAVSSAWADGEFGPQRREYTISDRGVTLLMCWADYLAEQQALNQRVIDAVQAVYGTGPR